MLHLEEEDLSDKMSARYCLDKSNKIDWNQKTVVYEMLS